MTNKITRNLSERFAAMSFLCACMIVFFHATPAPDAGSFNWWFFHLLGREGICCIAVPYFFVCSGYFLAGHFGEIDWWGKEVSKRVKSLVVPYFIWMSIGLVFSLCVVYAKNRFFHAATQNEFLLLPSWERIMLYLGMHPFRDIGVLWYVRTLFLFVLVSPAIFFFLRWPIKMVCILLVLHLVASYLFVGVLDIDMYFILDRFISIRGLLYFFLGAALRTGRFDLDTIKIPAYVGWLVLCLGVLFLGVKNLLQLASDGGLRGVVEALSVPFLIVGSWSILPVRGWMKGLAVYSFPIFLMHNIFLSLVSMVFMAVGLRDSVAMQIPIALLRTMCAIVGAIVVATSIKRVIPKLYFVMFGGR